MSKKPSKILAYLVVLFGGLMFLSGIAATIGYLGLPVILRNDFISETILGIQIGEMGTIFWGLIGGTLAIFHGLRSIANKPSSSLRLPPFYIFYIFFAIALGLGTALLNSDFPNEYLFPPIFLFGAALPGFAALSWALGRLNWPISWRQGALNYVSGNTLSISVTILLGSILPIIFYLLIEPLEYIVGDFIYFIDPGTSGFFERVFYSPMLIFYLLYIAFQAPFPEEFAKALGPRIMRSRIQNEAQAFALGLASGAGFAIIENMLYQGVIASWSGWTWGGITALRGIGAVGHSLWTGILALAIYRERARTSGWFGRLLRAYLTSVGLHTLWNGGYMALFYVVGLEYYADAGPELSVYGEYITFSLIFILVAMTAFNWWILARITANLAQDDASDLALAQVSPRILAYWALASAAIIIPIGAALGGALPEIKKILFP
ncbi:MAG: PrsW family intramembrane metalloprotease [Anaerolineae bacterium]|jgi:RsiW-degrading membrane proteinase PrsW (M82 family)|nr:PrsW family intramembrane metalloprotease [Anaerolineae bacterium]MBT7190267.1 PrsW family intramembrane metalloprotease [Anaerolineae bacterium]MBT7988617.1 PrsW family intramembrane metalloprotease [Anaerolineae bacterium]